MTRFVMILVMWGTIRVQTTLWASEPFPLDFTGASGSPVQATVPSCGHLPSQRPSALMPLPAACSITTQACTGAQVIRVTVIPSAVYAISGTEDLRLETWDGRDRSGFALSYDEAMKRRKAMKR